MERFHFYSKRTSAGIVEEVFTADDFARHNGSPALGFTKQQALDVLNRKNADHPDATFWLTSPFTRDLYADETAPAAASTLTPAQVEAAKRAVPHRADGSLQAAVPIDDQIATLKSEIGILSRVLDKKVQGRQMHPAAMADRLQKLRAGLATLEAVRDSTPA